jgi:hypothetical protein
MHYGWVDSSGIDVTFSSLCSQGESETQPLAIPLVR